jgi:DegV family protein with EDD domain
MVNILSDSCSDLDQNLLARFNVHSISLSVFVNNQTYHDGVDISLPELYRQVDMGGQLPKTSAPSVAEFIQFFTNFTGDIIYIGISARLSATLQSARLAVETLSKRNIILIDSKNLSTGIGLLVLKAAELRNQGLTSVEIVAQIESIIPKVRTSFMIDNLEYLYKGGRCSSMENIVGSLLKIRPVIEVKSDGSLGIKEKTRGTRLKSLVVLLENFKANLDTIDFHRVFITHSGCDEDGTYLAEELRKIAPIEDLLVTTAGCTIASHCGPNTIGILYLTK